MPKSSENPKTPKKRKAYDAALTRGNSNAIKRAGDILFYDLKKRRVIFKSRPTLTYRDVINGESSRNGEATKSTQNGPASAEERETREDGEAFGSGDTVGKGDDLHGWNLEDGSGGEDGETLNNGEASQNDQDSKHDEGSKTNSDGDYDGGSDDAPEISSGHGTRSSGPVRGPSGAAIRGGDTTGGTNRKRAAWEDIQRSWDTVVETDGSINSAVEGLREAGKRKRLLRDTTPIQRGIIRHLIVILDLSFAMIEKDLRPTRWLLTHRFAIEFITEYFEQNPISQLGIIGMRDGLAVPISSMSGNPTEHIENLRKFRKQEPQGNPSLQNALDMSRAALYHTPSHGTREVLIIFGALLTSDPGDIHDTISSLIKDRIRVSVVGLAAQVAICAELCRRTNAGDDSNYNVTLNEQHFRELFMALTTPPITRTKEQSESSLLMMGFPSRTTVEGEIMSFCACHHKLVRGGYSCSRCGSKVCSLPQDCPVCGLTLILSTHLARSYHHLFPLKNWVEVLWSDAGISKACFSCQSPFPKIPKGKGTAVENGTKAVGEHKSTSESGRYACPVCGKHFCIDCDVFAHEILHNCPGCQSDTRGEIDIDLAAIENGHAVNGDAMEE